jgi:hypothetical protein
MFLYRETAAEKPMDLPALEELLTRLKSLPVAEKSETNIFSVGARGHYENPVSDLRHCCK